MTSDHIRLQLMPEQHRAGPDDDWTGINDPGTRKKLQDRINERISRQRRQQICGSLYTGRESKSRTLHAPVNVMSSVNNKTLKILAPRSSTHEIIYASPQLRDDGIGSFTACEPDSEQTQRFISYFSARMHQEYLRCSPQLDSLISLVRFNSTRALVQNARILGLTSEILAPGTLSPFSTINGLHLDLKSLPSSLQPTLLQRTVDHHPWLDLLPIQEIRDNILRRDANSYDKAQLCRDIRGFQEVKNGHGGMVVWGQPWDPWGWEITEDFALKWPWVIWGCQRLFESTNHWRAIRGELPLFTQSGSIRGRRDYLWVKQALDNQ